MKQPECDREAARLLALQKNGRGVRTDRTMILVFVGLIAAFSLLFWILPDRDMSENENRTLATLPEFSLKTIVSGEFMREIPEYMADQFPARDFFITLKASVEALIGRGGSNGVIFAEDETLIPRDDLPNTENMAVNLQAFAAFADWCESRGISVDAAIAGRSADVLDHLLPDYYGSEYSDRLFETLASTAAACGTEYLNLRDPLRQRAADGEYVYYRTDHHWTTYGAYLAYAEIAQYLGDQPYPIDAFTPETVSDAFYGTTWSTAGASWISPDTMEYYRFEGDTEFTTAYPDGTAYPGFYDESYLTKKDKYSSFIGGNRGLVTVTKNGDEARETLLLIKDSFAHSVVPFLARHYDLVILDLRYYRLPTAELLSEYGVDRVLLLYNVDSLIATGSTGMLAVGLE